MNQEQTIMRQFGLTSQREQQAAALAPWRIGRIIAQHTGVYKVITGDGERLATVAGKFHFNAGGMADYPVVGDFVMLDGDGKQDSRAVIQQILPRQSLLVRRAAGTAQAEQAVAANMDTVFLCMALNQDFNVRRLERYLGVVWESGAVPVVVLTKADLCPDLSTCLRSVAAVAPGVDVVVTNGSQAGGAAGLSPYVTAGRTVAFIGSSGVGKSTLINALLGRTALLTQATRGDDKGRHTTTHRELFAVPEGGSVIDTPGMRELGIERADVDKAFGDIAALAQDCRFGDCTHRQEPGCAVQAAVTAGVLAAERLASYEKLQKEARYAGLNARQIETEKCTAMFGELGGRKNLRKRQREQPKRRG